MATKKKAAPKTKTAKPKASRSTRAKPRAGSRAGEVDSISFDLRRNLIHILGEEHYPHAEYLYHELCSNAWDEDATEVRIVEDALQPATRGQPATYNIRVTDNGNGMDFNGLQEYFTVGDSAKPERETTAVFDRPLIGRIGVGKVAILKVARRWTVTTEQHHGLAEPTRLSVHVDIDEWIAGRLPSFAVQYLEPTGQQGTEIVLQNARTRMREDRILRHIRRLPLGDNFMVWRNGTPVTPKEWSGIDMIKIDEEVEWESKGVRHTGPLTGEIWIRPEMPPREQAYLEEPKTEKDGLTRDAAGIEVLVSGDMVAREFFGAKSHGHGVNRIWGWVEAPWLPITGNRTDYLRDSPAGVAFTEAVKPLFDEAYKRIRYDKDVRAQAKKSSKKKAPEPEPQEGETASGGGNGRVSERYGEVVNRVLRDKPEFAPVLKSEATRGRGRPSTTLIYPVRPTGKITPFKADPRGTEIGIVEEPSSGGPDSMLRAQPGSVDKKSKAGKETEVEAGEIIVNTKAGIQLRFTGLGTLEAPYRWNLDKPDELTLDVNVDHKLYEDLGQEGGDKHRLYCAWVVSLALAERMLPNAGAQVADYIEHLSFELYKGWGPSSAA